MTYTINIRPKRQITLPQELLDILDLTIGDSLTLNIQSDQAILIPQKQVALDSLREIQSAFNKSQTTEDQLQSDLKQQRSV